MRLARLATAIGATLLAGAASGCAAPAHSPALERLGAARHLSVVFVDFHESRAKLYVDERLVFDGGLDVADASTGVSRTLDIVQATGPVRMRLVSKARTVDAAVTIAPDTKFVVINPHTAPYIAAETVLLLD